MCTWNFQSSFTRKFLGTTDWKRLRKILLRLTAFRFCSGTFALWIKRLLVSCRNPPSQATVRPSLQSKSDLGAKCPFWPELACLCTQPSKIPTVSLQTPTGLFLHCDYFHMCVVVFYNPFGTGVVVSHWPGLWCTPTWTRFPQTCL